LQIYFYEKAVYWDIIRRGEFSIIKSQLSIIPPQEGEKNRAEIMNDEELRISARR